MTNKKIKRLEKQYAYVVFLNHVKDSGKEVVRYNKQLFERLGIHIDKTMIKELLKFGYIKKKKEILISSTPKGRTILTKEFLCLTEEANIFLNEKKDIILFFKFATPYVSALEYLETKEKMKNCNSFEKIMLNILIHKAKQSRKEKDYEGIQNLMFEIGEIYRWAGDEVKAIYSYLVSLYYSVSGIEYYDYFQGYINKKIKKRELIQLYKGIYINPELIKEIRQVKAGYRSYMIDHIYQNNNVSLNLCGKQSFKKLLETILQDNYSYNEWEIHFYNTFKRVVDVADKHR